MKIKALLYCTKAKPMLRKFYNYCLDKHNDNYYWKKGQVTPYNLNGKIVAECDYEVEEIVCAKLDYALSYSIDGTGQAFYDNSIHYEPFYLGLNISNINLSKRSCLTNKEMYDYLQGEDGKAIHIKNLHIFDEPRELNSVRYKNHSVKSAPQNMMKVYDYSGEYYILISIRPQWLCKILKGEKTIEVRKKVLKEMLK